MSRPQPVTIDAPAPPTLSIISPTPRAFTFPRTHNLVDSPYSSPSHTPFQADLRSLVISPVTPPPTSLPSTHKRRKSSHSLDVERRPRKGDEDYVKRPENAFILFRRKCCEERAAEEADGTAKKQRQADLSKAISQQWKTLSAEERQYWEQLAKEKKKEHELLYPDYVYRPQRQPKNKKRKGAKRGEYDHDTDTTNTPSDSVTFVLPDAASRPHGRSVSAPNRPCRYSTIQIPNVFVSPSCPTSPSTPTSLLPMISGRSGNSDFLGEDDFDFRPNTAFTGKPSQLLPAVFNFDGISRGDDMLLPLSSGSSIGSGSSGPSSPQSGPYTPTSGPIAHLERSFSQLDTSSPERRDPIIHGEGDWDLPQFGMDLFGPSGPSPFPSIENTIETDFCSPWGEAQPTGTMVWNAPPPEQYSSIDENAVIFSRDDFDLSAIPPIQLDLPKFVPGEAINIDLDVEFLSSTLERDTERGVMGFDDIMGGNTF